MNDSSLGILLEVIDQGFDRQSWHGIWEHVLHAAYWKYTGRRRIRGEKRGSFPNKGSNWFTPQEQSAAAWRRGVQLLIETHESMRTSIADLSGAQLHKRIPGTKITYFFLVSGIAAHDVYHAGQIQLLKRLQK